MNTELRDRFTAEEWTLREQGRCSHQTGYGLPGIRYCGKPSDSASLLGNCLKHEDGDE